MYLLLLFLAILIFVLWSKVHQNFLQIRILQDRLNPLEKKIADLAQAVKDLRGKKVVLYPDEFKSGNIIYPYSAAKN